MAHEKLDSPVLEEVKSELPDYSHMDDKDVNDFDTGPVSQNSCGQ